MKTKFYYGMTVLATLGLASCSNEILDPDDGKDVADGDKSYYVSVAIHGDMPGTRAGASDDGNPNETNDENSDFINGKDDESLVKDAYFVFYNSEGEMIGNVVNVQLGNPTPVTSPNGTVEQYYYQVVRVDTYKGQGKPAQVMCYLNPVTAEALLNPLSKIQEITREQVVRKGAYTVDGITHDLFPMSNSVYYKTEEGNNPSLDDTKFPTPTIAVAIKDNQVFNTEADAQKIAASTNEDDLKKIINIYVERYASKLFFKVGNPSGSELDNSVVSPYKTTSKNAEGTADVNVELAFVAKGWGLNAEAKNTYVVKSFRQATSTGQILGDNYPWDMLNKRINANNLPWDSDDHEFTDPGDNFLTGTKAWVWNNASYHRSYWAVSPAYFQEKYPEVASDLKQIIPVENGNPIEIDIPINQIYISYNDIVPDPDVVGSGSKGNFDYNGSTPHYYRETTVGAPALASKNPAAAMPSVVLAGQYTLTVGNIELTDNPTFYTYMTNNQGKPYVYFDNKTTGDGTESVVTGTMSMYKRFLLQQTVLYKQVTNADGTKSYKLLNANDNDDLHILTELVKIEKPSAPVKMAHDPNNPLKLADRQYTLQFREGANFSGVYIANGNGFKTVNTTATELTEEQEKTQILLTKANYALMSQVGYAVKYKAGKAFFIIPVKHLGWYRGGNTQKYVTENGATTGNLNTKSIDWSLVRVGDFGMVRNHIYNITLNSITGLAAGIGDETTPIIPPADTKDYYMVYRVNILKWALVPPQGVDL